MTLMGIIAEALVENLLTLAKIVGSNNGLNNQQFWLRSKDLQDIIVR